MVWSRVSPEVTVGPSSGRVLSYSIPPPPPPRVLDGTPGTPGRPGARTLVGNGDLRSPRSVVGLEVGREGSR